MNLLPPDQPEPTSLAELDATWSARTTYWARKLGRLRLGVEPIEEQLAKYRRVTWMLTAIPAFFSAFLFTLFAVFRRPDIGLVAAAILFLPIIAGAWLGDFLRTRRGHRYLLELENFQRARARMLQTETDAARSSQPPA